MNDFSKETGQFPLWNQVKFIDCDSHQYKRRVKEAIQIRFHPNNINRDSRIEIPEAWISMIKKLNSCLTTKRTSERIFNNYPAKSRRILPDT